MRRYAAVFLLCFGLSCHAAEGVDAAAPADPVAEAITRADEYGSQNQFDKAARLLAPYESLERADVDFALAYALYSDAVNGVHLDDADKVDVSRALALAERSAAKGNGNAFNLLFLMHVSGFGLPEDEAKAYGYLQRGVAAGDAGAKLNYAVRLYRGGTPLGQDRDKACGVFKELQALPKPDPISGYYLGLAHFRGDCGFAESAAKGMELIEAAARSDIRDAQTDMGRSLEFGWVGEKDIKQALAWYQLAADRGDPFAQWRVGMAYVNGEQRAKDAAQAVAWFQRSAASEYGLGLGSLAVMVATGDGIAQDFTEARSLYARAAAAGNPHGYRGLAVMHLRGEGGAVDPVRARVLYWQALQAGNPKESALLHNIESQMSAEQRQQAQREIEALGGPADSLQKTAK
jgi:TPR repeat protein